MKRVCIVIFQDVVARDVYWLLPIGRLCPQMRLDDHLCCIFLTQPTPPHASHVRQIDDFFHDLCH
jgi:hypothetical protein